jgi:hypothetical protein
VAVRNIEGAWEKEITAVDGWATGVVLWVAAEWWISMSSACELFVAFGSSTEIIRVRTFNRYEF